MKNTIKLFLFLCLLFNIYVFAQPDYTDTTYIVTSFGVEMDTLTFSKYSWTIIDIETMTEVPVYRCVYKWSVTEGGVTVNKNIDGVFDSVLVQAGRHYNNHYYIIYVHGVRLKAGNPIVEDSVHNSSIYLCEIALPVELISFSAHQHGDAINLNWRTETEVNNYGFEIERKFEFTNWEKIGFVQGYGNSNSPKDYIYTDSLSVGKKTNVFYRLKQIDTDGTYEYHNTIIVELIPTVEMNITLYPNPFNSYVIVQFPLLENLHLYVYSILGELVSDKSIEFGQTKITVNLAEQASGTYIFVIKNKDIVLIKKGLLVK